MSNKSRLLEVFEYVNKIKINESLGELSYEEFVKQYEDAFNMANKYTPNEVGSQTYTNKMAQLSDDYPEYIEKFEDNLDDINYK